MGIAFLKMDRARIKWRLKLSSAFEKSQSKAVAHHRAEDGTLTGDEKKGSSGGKWALFMLPFVTVLREGLEAVVFVGGVGNPTLPVARLDHRHVGLTQPSSHVHPDTGRGGTHLRRYRR